MKRPNKYQSRIQELAAARIEQRKAMAEFLRYQTDHYERSWTAAIQKVRRLEDEIRAREAN